MGYIHQGENPIDVLFLNKIWMSAAHKEKGSLEIKNPLELGRIYSELGRIMVLIAKELFEVLEMIFICLKEDCLCVQ